MAMKTPLFVLAASLFLLTSPNARALDELVVVCASTPAHRDCGKTEHFKVAAEAEGKAAFRQMRARLYDPSDPVARILSNSKWGIPDGFQDLITEAFFYPVDKANCVYAEAERVYYGEESGPIEEGTNENTARAAIFYLNNVTPTNLSFREQGVFHGPDRLMHSISGTDARRLSQEWAEIFGRHCKGKR